MPRIGKISLPRGIMKWISFMLNFEIDYVFFDNG